MSATLRLLLVGAIAGAAAASASSSSNGPPPTGAYPPETHPSPQEGGSGAPPSQPMEPTAALGLWKTSFGPVKIEVDPSGGESRLMGVWVYDREGQEVVGFFSGELGGNVLELSWEEPAEPTPLTGSGYLVFDPAGRSFTGRWWTDNRDRGGDWNGWRSEPAGAADAPPPSSGEEAEAAEFPDQAPTGEGDVAPAEPPPPPGR